MRKDLISIAAALALGLTLVVSGAPPALASTFTDKVCTEYGNNYCIGASSVTDGTPLTNNNIGRDIVIHDQGFKNNLGFEVYRLEFAVDTSKCVGFSDTGLAEVRDCKGNTNYTNWENITTQGAGSEWGNNSFDGNNCAGPHDQGDLLTSDNQLGSQLYCSVGATSGELIRWLPQASP